MNLGVKNLKKGDWVGYAAENINNINNELSLINAGAALKLLTNSKFNNLNEAILTLHDNYLKKSDIQYLIDRNVKTSRKIYNNLLDLNILIEEKSYDSKHIKFNTDFHAAGSKSAEINISYLKEIENVKLNSLGLFYKVLPYIHCESLYLVNNPKESNLKELNYINRNELSVLLDVTPQTINTLMNELCDAGIISVEHFGSNARYFVSSNLIK